MHDHARATTLQGYGSVYTNQWLKWTRANVGDSPVSVNREVPSYIHNDNIAEAVGCHVVTCEFCKRYGMLAVSKNGVDGLKSTQVGLNILPGDNQPAAIARDGPRDGRTRNLDHLRGDVVSVVGL